MATEHDNVFLFLPNIVGYVRIVLVSIACWYMSTSYMAASLFYITSWILDELDGRVARAYNQVTRFGGLFDIAIDVTSTVCLLVRLAIFYPEYACLLQLVVACDIFAGWIIVTAAASGKSAHGDHKKQDNVILNTYYKKSVLNVAIYGNQMFWFSLYLLRFTPGPAIFGFSSFKLLASCFAPVSLMKCLIHFVQCYEGARQLAAIDVKERKAKREQEENTDTIKQRGNDVIQPARRLENSTKQIQFSSI